LESDMGVQWSSPRRKREKRDHPDHVEFLVGVGIDPADPSVVALAFARAERAPYAEPDHEQEPGVIYPTAVYQPWINGGAWDRCIIVTEREDGEAEEAEGRQ